jgi:hypothetical protein
MAKVTWVGDADESVEAINQFGYSFTKGKPTTIDAKHKAKFEGNPFFKIEDAAK